VELDAFRLNPTRGEMTAGDLRVFRPDPDVTRPAAVLARNPVGGRGDGDMAMSDIEIQRRVNLGVVELHQHVVAGNAELSRAKGDKGCNVEAAHADQVEPGLAGGKAEPARRRVFELRLGLDSH